MSAWEQGRQLPTESGEAALCEALEAILGVPSGEFREAIKDDREAGGVLRLDVKSRAVEELTRFVESVGEATDVEVWLLGPESPPIAEAEAAEVRDLWQRNLGAGVRYVVVWCLDLHGRAELRRFCNESRQIGRQVSDDTASRNASDEEMTARDLTLPGYITHLGVSCEAVAGKRSGANGSSIVDTFRGLKDQDRNRFVLPAVPGIDGDVVPAAALLS